MESNTTASDPTILSSKRAVYVGGLADAVTPQLLRAAMIPFGPIKSLDIVSFLGQNFRRDRHYDQDVISLFMQRLPIY